MPYHVDQRDVEEHPASDGKDPGVSCGVSADNQTQDQPQVTHAG